MSTDVKLSNLLYLTVVSALQEKTVPKPTQDTLAEIVVLDGAGSQVPFKAYLNAFAPNMTVDEIGKWFEDNFSAFIFYDKDGAWPGFVAKLKNGVNIDDARKALLTLEASGAGKFYLSDPGTFTAFKAGQLNGNPTRYSTATQKGASFNYGIIGEYFIMSTSYTGLKASTPLLGL